MTSSGHYTARTTPKTSKMRMCTGFGLHHLEKENLVFLDELHHTTKQSSCGFITKGNVKFTAQGRLFLNNKSHHLIHIFKSIIYGGAKRLRRLNEIDADYTVAFQRLKESSWHQIYQGN
ncbi:unnamed protein product [Clavelina lepadiformis]|uniref:Uncharacterized protein n=1 Tax=Clavelina lepadiformis TaxID=159417 RepID=A0ABP0F537_CLALP